MKTWLVLAFLALLTGGCANDRGVARATAVQEGKSPVVLEGRLISNFEENEFIACTGEVYWVSQTGPAYELGKQATQNNRALRITAVVSPEGTFGHMGRYKQEIVIKTAELGALTPECGNP